MKVLYVSDNRVRGNFGCRATSTALSQMICKHNQIVGFVSGKYTNYDTNELIYWKCIPSWMYPFIGRIVKSSIARSIVFKFLKKISNRLYHHYLAGPCDYISLDFDKSISNLKKCLPANPHLQEFNLDNYDFDAMVVNGEGSFIFSTPEWHWREALNISMLMHWAQLKGKKVYFMNAMLSKESTTPINRAMIDSINKIFVKCDELVVRESMSYEFAQKYFPNVNVRIIPDALFTWYPIINDGHKVDNFRYYIPHPDEKDEMYDYPDFCHPYICISGSSSAKISYNRAETINAYVLLVNELRKVFNENIFLVEVCEGDNFLREVSEIAKVPIIPIETPIVAAAKILSQSRVFISGRYHPAIMASIGGTPCVFMGSNSHKIYSLQKLLQYQNPKEYNEVPTSEDVKSIVATAIDLLNQGESLRNKIQMRALQLYKEALLSDEILANLNSK